MCSVQGIFTITLLLKWQNILTVALYFSYVIHCFLLLHYYLPSRCIEMTITRTIWLCIGFSRMLVLQRRMNIKRLFFNDD